MEGQKYRAVILAENKSNEDLKKLRDRVWKNNTII